MTICKLIATAGKTIIAIVCLVLNYYVAFGFIVTDLEATLHNGQVFLTWTNPSENNLQYNIYRSQTKFTSSDQLTNSTLLGFVRDNSSKNIRLSELLSEDIYLRIEDNGTPLSPDQGLYVVTCTAKQSFYYAVTVTDLATGHESKKITVGKNSLSNALSEKTGKPKPVLQFTEAWSGDELERYVQFVSNQETNMYPAMVSTGSYAFNFYLLKRGSASEFPLFALYEGLTKNSLKGNGLGLFDDQTITGCYILGFDDWLPVEKPNGKVGDNCYWFGYHEDFDIYTLDNPIPSSGIVKTFAQNRYIAAIRWAKENLPVDASRVYAVGVSAGGYGALLTAAVIPGEIAAVYNAVEPVSVGPNGMQIYEEMWGLSSSNLKTDFSDPETELPLSFNTLSDMRTMLHVNRNLDLPIIFDIHGRNDHSVGWSLGKIEWLDSLQSNYVGGVFYWDQRAHNGSGADFLDSEITPDFYRYQTTKSYPAFSNCSINQDPGNGTKSSGTNYGAINGYLDWEDDITDNSCDYSIELRIKDFFVGGKLGPKQYNTCTTDVTVRRLQDFKPLAGALIKWKNFDASNTKIQSGTISYDGDLITLNDIIVNKSGNRIELTITGCEKDAELQESGPTTYFMRSGNHYVAHLIIDKDEEISLNIYDMLGRCLMSKKVDLIKGTNSIELPSIAYSIFFVELEGPTFSSLSKLGL